VVEATNKPSLSFQTTQLSRSIADDTPHITHDLSLQHVASVSTVPPWLMWPPKRKMKSCQTKELDLSGHLGALLLFMRLALQIESRSHGLKV